MDAVAVCGPVNMETSVPVGAFPIVASRRRKVHGIESHISGIACNVAVGLAALGAPVRLTAITGTDPVGRFIRDQLSQLPGVDVAYVDLPHSPQTVVLLGADGSRAVLSDLRAAPSARIGGEPDLAGCCAFVPVSIPANLPALARAVEAGTPVFVDIQSVAAVSDPDLEPFCHAAEVLAMSSANIPCSPEEWLRQMGDRYAPPVMVLGLADRGALLARDAGKRIDHVAAAPAQVRSTVGAGDALWACFIDGYLRSGDALWALERAVVAAAHKVATIGGAEGLITASELQSMGWAAPS